VKVIFGQRPPWTVNDIAHAAIVREHLNMRTLLTLAVLLAAGVSNATPNNVSITDVRVKVGDSPDWAGRALDDSAWEQSRLWDVDPQGRVLWLRARVEVPRDIDPKTSPVAVHAMMAASWDLYWNGQLIGHNGTPGSTPQAEVPGRIEAEIYVPPQLLTDRGNVLALRISTQHLGVHLRAPIQYLGIGPYGHGINSRLPSGLALLAAGPLTLGALYFAVMFALDRRDIASLLLALLAVAVLGQLLAESLRGFYAYTYPVHGLRLQVIFAFALLSSLLLVAYLARRYAGTRGPLAVAVTCALGALAAAFGPGYDGKTTLTLFAGAAVALVISLIGHRARIAGAGATVLALIVVLIAMIVGVTQFLDLGYYVAATALLLFLFARQAVELRRSQRAAGAAALRNAQLELELIRQKIQPHFLMNTLTALTELVESSPRTGVRMIEALAAEFRTVSAMSGRSLVSLREELSLCREHLSIMSFRGARQYELQARGIDPDASLPPAVLHTLIENAMSHNRYPRGATFVLDAHREARSWTYRLHSPRDQPAAHRAGSGTGHDYVRGRLVAAYGSAAQFSCGPTSADTWTDVIIVPARDAS
jgi:hypothetical protein